MKTSWNGLFEIPPDDTIQVRAGDVQKFLRQYMMGNENPGLTVTTTKEQKAQAERDDNEVFCTIQWTRTDIVDVIEDICGVQLKRDPANHTEVEDIIDDVISEVQKPLREGSISEGWDIIKVLMPDEAIEYAKEIANTQDIEEPASIAEQAEEKLGVSLKGEAETMRESASKLADAPQTKPLSPDFQK